MHTLYHHTPSENRESIRRLGLLTRFSDIGGVFFSDRADHATRSDVWAVDVQGLDVEEDWTTCQDPAEWGNWFVVWGDIPPERLRLIERQMD